MNHDADVILHQLEARQALLLSLEPSGRFVRFDPTVGLCLGEVDGIPAMVPVEYATTYSQHDLQVMRQRRLSFDDMCSMSDIVGEELLRLETEYAWVMECGGT